MKENKAPSAFLILCGGIHQWSMASTHKGPAMRKTFMQFLECTAAFVSSILWKEILCTAVTIRKHHGISFDWQLYCLSNNVYQKTVEQDIKIPHNWSIMRGTHWWPMDSPYKGPAMRKHKSCYFKTAGLPLFINIVQKNKFPQKKHHMGVRGFQHQWHLYCLFNSRYRNTWIKSAWLRTSDPLRGGTTGDIWKIHYIHIVCSTPHTRKMKENITIPHY